MSSPGTTARDMSAVEWNLSRSSYLAAVLRGEGVRRGLGHRARARRPISTTWLLKAVFGDASGSSSPAGGSPSTSPTSAAALPFAARRTSPHLLQDALGLLLRGESSGGRRTARVDRAHRGTLRPRANPVLRDLTERIVVASEGAVRSGARPGNETSTARHSVNLTRRILGGHDRPLGDPTGERTAGRPPRTVSR